MTSLKKIFLCAAFTCLAFSFADAQQVKRAAFDVTNYNMDVTLAPTERKINATVDVTFTPLEDTRSVTFELNGSLKVDSIARIQSNTMPAATPKLPAKPVRPAGASSASPQITFIQDPAGVQDIGPNVRIDLGETVTKDSTVTLRFKYSGILDGPAGGPLLNKRLAFIGDDSGYLMYAARWFPFHDYAADRATADILVSVPAGFQVVGTSDAPASTAGGKTHLVLSKPGLPGTLAYAKYPPRSLRFGDTELQFLARPGADAQVSAFGEVIGKAFQNYKKRFGQPDCGDRLTVVEIDDESLDYYTGPGIMMISARQFESARDNTEERLQRETAYQWWGQTVGLRSFDDAWLSQGLAEYSAYSLRESMMDEAKQDDLRRSLLEKALTFEQTASLLRAPSTLDDQSTAYQYIMYGKGAIVFKLLRETLGDQKFEQLLRTYLQKYRGKNASIDDLEKLSTEISGQNMRYFFARWVEGTGVPEFTADYQILRTRGGKFVTRGTVKQNYDNLRLPVTIQLVSEGDQGRKSEELMIDDTSADFNIESTGKPIEVVIDPGFDILRISPDLRVSSIARRGIEQLRDGNYTEAQTQFEAALKLDRSNSWVYYNLANLFLEQRNFDLAIDNYKAALSGRLDPPWLTVWSLVKMGNAYDAKGDRTRAVAAYKKAQQDGSNYDNAQDAVSKYMASPFDPRTENNTANKR